MAGKTGFKLSYALLALSVIALGLAFGFEAYQQAQLERRQTPRLALDSLVKSIRAFRSRTGRFPVTLAELEGRVWHHRQPKFGADGRSLALANYYYLYTRSSPSECALWAIPTGVRRQEGATHFLALTSERLRRWKGAPLELAEVECLSALLTPAELAVLGLTEQTPVESSRRP